MKPGPIYDNAIRQLSFTMPGLHALLSQRFPQALWMGDPARFEIALTFDDGPDSKDTPQLLALLERHAIRATFFQIGKRAQAKPHLVGEVAAAGHVIGIHGYRHRHFWMETPAVLEAQLGQTQSIISAAADRAPSAIQYVRPPFGTFTGPLLRRMAHWGYRPVMWTVVPLHWMQSAEASIHYTTRHIAPGAIIVLHEGLNGPPVASLAEPILDYVLTQGYRFVTIDEMWMARERTGA